MTKEEFYKKLALRMVSGRVTVDGDGSEYHGLQLDEHYFGTRNRNLPTEWLRLQLKKIDFDKSTFTEEDYEIVKKFHFMIIERASSVKRKEVNSLSVLTKKYKSRLVELHDIKSATGDWWELKMKIRDAFKQDCLINVENSGYSGFFDYTKDKYYMMIFS